MNKKKILILCCTYGATLCLSAFIAWCGGYNFDERNPDVAACLISAIIFSIIPAAVVGIVIDITK